MDQDQLKEKARQARIDIIESVHAAGAGHPGGSLSIMDVLTYLYQVEIPDIDLKNRNKLVLSKGHAAPALYAALKGIGVLNKEDLLTLRKINSKLQGHPNMHDTKGVDMSTGSLGQGISCAVGIALANRIKKLECYTYCICGDGEFEEGQCYEALMAAKQYGLDHLILFLDHNGLQIDGKIEDVMCAAPFEDKFKAFGFDVITIDGHDFSQIENAIEQMKCSKNPSAIVCNTIKGKGVSFMENQVSWHGKAPNDEQYQIAIKELGGVL